MTNQQDWHVCELSQKGISSRAYSRGLTRREKVFPQPGIDTIYE